MPRKAKTEPTDNTFTEFIKGYPFLGKSKSDNTFEDNEHLVEDIRFNIREKSARRIVYVIPGTIIPTQYCPYQKRQGFNVKELGATTKLPKRHFFAVLILRNEILACLGQAVSKPVLQRQFMKEFPSTRKTLAKSYFANFTKKRYDYNNGQMYKDHRIPPLFCFYYNESGYIRHSLYPTQLANYAHCRRQLLKAKFADPRFFTLTQMEQFRLGLLNDDPEYDGWHIPDLNEVQSIEAKIKKPLYDAITFPPGYGRLDAPDRV